jgi:hypothetical protein
VLGPTAGRRVCAGVELIKRYYRDHGYTGDRQLLGSNNRVAGGCIGQNAEGTRWNCYLGDEAVKHDVLIEQFLDEPLRSKRGLFTMDERLGIDQLRAHEDLEWWLENSRRHDAEPN